MHEIWQRFRENKLALAALGLIGGYAVVAIAAPWLAPYDPYAISMDNLASPSVAHWLGTDQLGRDVLSRILYGARLSMSVAVASVAFALVGGTLVGLVSGYFAGWVDTALSRVVDVMFALPEILLALVIMAVLGQGLTNVTIAVGIVYTPIFARLCRGAVLSVRQQPYVEAARALGFGHARIIGRHVLPNVAAPLIVQTTLSFAFAILAEAALSFLGLTGEADAPSWGLMLQQGKDQMQRAWWIAVFPGAAITLAVLGFNLLGDGLRDALDPRRVRGE